MSGSDSTGNGTILYPYLTITYAMSTITDSSPTKRYVVKVGPGNWTDNFSLVANVEVVGYNVLATKLLGTIDLNDPSWNNAADNRSGFEDLFFDGTGNFDFTAQSSNDGKLYFYNIRFGTSPTFTAFDPNGGNQVTIQNSLFFNGLTLNGGVLFLGDDDFVGGPITINSSPLAYVNFEAIGGGGGAGYASPAPTPINVTFNYTAGGAFMVGYLYNFTVDGVLSGNGPMTTVTATCSSIVGTTSFTGGSTLTVIGLCNATGPTGPTGPNGPAGSTGPTGPTGPRAAFALQPKLKWFMSIRVVAIPLETGASFILTPRSLTPCRRSQTALQPKGTWLK